MKLFANLSLALSLLALSANAQNVVSGSGCNGFAVDFTGQPQIGTSYTLSCSGGPVSAPLALFLGVPDPVGTDISFVGATGCSIYISLGAFASIGGLSTDGSGGFSTVVNLANNPVHIGLAVGQQFAAIDALANPLGVVTTDLLTSTIF